MCVRLSDETASKFTTKLSSVNHVPEQFNNQTSHGHRELTSNEIGAAVAAASCLVADP